MVNDEGVHPRVVTRLKGYPHFALFLNMFTLESSKQGLILLIYNCLLEINYYPTAI